MESNFRESPGRGSRNFTSLVSSLDAAAKGLEEIIGIQAEMMRQYFGCLIIERATEKRPDTNIRYFGKNSWR